MKKIFALSVIVLLAFNASAQFQKGNKVLGFGLNVNSTDNEIKNPPSSQTVKGTAIGLFAELGFATRQNKINGFFVGLGYGWNKYFTNTQPSLTIENSNFAFTGGYSIRQYKKLGGDFFVFADGRAAANYLQSLDMQVTDNKTKSLGVDVGLYPGIAYKWTDRFLFELRFADFVSVGYRWQKNTTQNTITNTQNNFHFGTSLGLGYLDNIGIGARWVIK